MNREDELIDLIDSISEASLDPELWSSVLVKLADTMRIAHVGLATFDWRAQTFSAIAPRSDPDRLASYCTHWAIHDPLLQRMIAMPEGEIYTLGSLMPQEEFTKTEFFRDWWLPSGTGLAALGTNLLVGDHIATILAVAAAPDVATLDDEQVRIFETAQRHIRRAVSIHRRLWMLDLDRTAGLEMLENLPQGVLLVDSGARVVFANAAAKAMLDAGDGLVLHGGCLDTRAGGSLQSLVTSCALRSPRPHSSVSGGASIEIPRGPGQVPLEVTVAPVRSERKIADLPWLGLRAPVALVTVTDPDVDRRRLEQRLRETFGLTPAESSLATEIVKGDGRKAAAQRRGVALSTARAQLSSIFEKTGTRRQAELVRLLLDLMASTGLRHS